MLFVSTGQRINKPECTPPRPIDPETKLNPLPSGSDCSTARLLDSGASGRKYGARRDSGTRSCRPTQATQCGLVAMQGNGWRRGTTMTATACYFSSPISAAFLSGKHQLFLPLSHPCVLGVSPVQASRRSWRSWSGRSLWAGLRETCSFLSSWAPTEALTSHSPYSTLS